VRCLEAAAHRGRSAAEGPSMSMLSITLTGSQEHAVRRLIGILHEAAACYQFSGGFAGNLHGSRWPLHDLDLDVAQQDLLRLAKFLQPYISRPLGLYEDAEFRLYLLRATFEGMDIDVNQAEDAYGRCGGQWVSLQTNLTRRQRMPLFGLHVWVQPLEDLIAYKALIGRSADVAELQALQHRLRA
jgi:hypothetical protein